MPGACMTFWAMSGSGPRRLARPLRARTDDGSAWLDISGVALRVVRGGSFNDNQRNLRVAFRHYFVPGGRGRNLGFRVVVSPFSSDSDR